MKNALMSLVLGAGVLLAPVAAMAVWTSEEKVEVTKILATADQLTKTTATFARHLRSAALADPHGALVRTTYTQLAQSIENTFFVTTCILGRLDTSNFGSPCLRGQDRSAQLAGMYKRMNAALASRDRARTGLTVLGRTVLANSLDNLPIETFHRSLAYADPRPASWPRIVGPHGDGAVAQTGMLNGMGYTTITVDRMLRVWNASPGFGDILSLSYALESMALAQAQLFRIWFGDMEIMLADDVELVLDDTACGSGLRPASFFALLLRVEYAAGDPSRPTACGRPGKAGVRVWLAQTQSAFERYVRSLPPGRRDSRSVFTENGVVWQNLDRWLYGVIQFFHEIPAPPG